MGSRLTPLFLMIAAVVFLATPRQVLAGLGIGAIKDDSFQTKPVKLKGFSLGKGKDYPPGDYSFKLIGTGKPGAVEVRILNDKGKEVGKTTARFGGGCPGKPQIASFAELGYSKASPVKTTEHVKRLRVTIECEQGSKIEFTMAAVRE